MRDLPGYAVRITGLAGHDARRDPQRQQRQGVEQRGLKESAHRRSAGIAREDAVPCPLQQHARQPFCGEAGDDDAEQKRHQTPAELLRQTREVIAQRRQAGENLLHPFGKGVQERGRHPLAPTNALHDLGPGNAGRRKDSGQTSQYRRMFTHHRPKASAPPGNGRPECRPSPVGRFLLVCRRNFIVGETHDVRPDAGSPFADPAAHRPCRPEPRRHRDRVADRRGPIHRYTYRDAHKRTKQVAEALIELGIKPGDRIGTLAWNGYRHFELYYGVSGMGAVCHTINPASSPSRSPISSTTPRTSSSSSTSICCRRWKSCCRCSRRCATSWP